MSSASTHTLGQRSSTAASARSSSAEYTAPVGLQGEFSMSHFVRGVSAASSVSGNNLNPRSTVDTSTGVPPASFTISGYDTQHGVGITTSSPASSVAKSAL